MSRIQARNVNHPEHRQSLNSEKYELIKDAILASLPEAESGASLSFTELETAVTNHLLQNNAPMELFPKAGSVRWYTKSVQLDLEARGVIERVPQKSPLRFRRILVK